MAFEEKSGLVTSATPWGCWGQTIEEVHVTVNVPQGTKSSHLDIAIKPSSLRVAFKGKPPIIEGKLAKTVIADDSLWTLEDSCRVRIMLVKALRDPHLGAWRSLLEGQYEADAITFADMEKKITLERYQRENPGFDFSSAEVSGNYEKGGPQFAA